MYCNLHINELLPYVLGDSQCIHVVTMTTVSILAVRSLFESMVYHYLINQWYGDTLSVTLTRAIVLLLLQVGTKHTTVRDHTLM